MDISLDVMNDMDVDQLKLSNYDSEEKFINALIERSCNPEQIDHYKKDEDFDRIKRLMAAAKKLAKLASENDLCFWAYANHDGKAVVGVSWGTWYSQINMETDGDDWVERPYTIDDVSRMEKEYLCK